MPKEMRGLRSGRARVALFTDGTCDDSHGTILTAENCPPKKGGAVRAHVHGNRREDVFVTALPGRAFCSHSVLDMVL
jgi:hypothetical protein